MIPQQPFEHSISQFLSPIEHLMNDSTISEIMINGPREIWIERKGKLTETQAFFPTKQSLYSALNNISQYAGCPFNDEHPILEAFLPDGSRLEAILPPVAQNGPTVAIRRFAKNSLSMSQLVELDSITAKAAVFLGRAICAKKNIIVSGGTGSGKTSLLCALSGFFKNTERLVVLEDTHELNLRQKHTVYLETRSADEKGRGRITIRDLLKATLRLRPDRIVVGEIRGEEALDLLQAMSSGHGGSMSTVHANSPLGALQRLETMTLMSDQGLPHQAIRAQIAAAVDFVVQIERTSSGQRQVSAISSIKKQLRGADYIIEPLFYRTHAGMLRCAPSATKPKKKGPHI